MLAYWFDSVRRCVVEKCFGLGIVLIALPNAHAAQITAQWILESDTVDTIGNNDLTAGTGTSFTTLGDRTGMLFDNTVNGMAFVSPGDTALDIPTTGTFAGEFSVSSWIRYNTNNSTYARAISRTDGTYGYNLAFGTGHLTTSPLSIRVLYNNTTYAVTSDLPVLTRGVWGHVAFTFDNDGATVLDKIKLYVDGTPVALSAGGGTVLGNSAFRLGMGDAAANSYSGMLSDVRFFRGALSQSEVDASMVPVPEPSAMAIVSFGILSLLGLQLRRRNV